MGRAMLSKSLTQFSIAGRGCVPSLLLDLRPNYGEGYGMKVTKIMVTSFKRSLALPHSLPPTLQHATTKECPCWRLLDTHGQVWASLLWGHCSFLLGPGAHEVLFVPSKNLFPQSYVNSDGFMWG